MKRSKFAISRDKDIKAQKAGKRAANKNRETYYEYRENRTDSDLRKKLEWGGTAESSETGAFIGGENASSMYNTGGGISDPQDKEDAKILSKNLGKGLTAKEFGEYIEDYFKNPADYDINVDSEYYEAIEATWGQIADENRMPVWQKATVESSPIFKEYSKMATGGGLKGNQKKLDLNKNGKLDAEDFKMLRGKKMVKGGGVQSFKKGNKVKTREGKIETIVRKNKNGNYETQESDYTWNPSDLTLVSKMETGGGLADVPETFPDTDAMSYAGGGGVGELEIGNEVELELNNGKIIKGKVEKTNPLKIRTDATSTQVIPNALIKNITKYAQGGSTKGFEYSIGGL